MFSVFKAKPKQQLKPKSCCEQTDKIRSNNTDVKNTLKELTSTIITEQQKGKTWIKKDVKEV